jgi:nitrogen PTS system EIIA component
MAPRRPIARPWSGGPLRHSGARTAFALGVSLCRRNDYVLAPCSASASPTDRTNSRILDFLAGKGVTPDLDVTARKQALEVMAMRMATVHGLNAELVFRALWRREQAASTGIALPHARIGGIDQPILLFARPRQPIVFSAPDGQPVSILLAIVVPEHASDDHLQILALAVERLSSDALRTQLRRATNPSIVEQLFA